jgi:hypothetical protein
MARKSPMQTVIERFGKAVSADASREDHRKAKDEAKRSLAVKLSELLTPKEGEESKAFQERLFFVPNRKLLSLLKLQDRLKKDFGDKKNLIEAILAHQKRSNDKDYVAKLQQFSVGRLLSIAPKAK